MNWRELVTENWPYKLAALLFALLLWFNVTAAERETFPVGAQLQVEERDPEWVLVETRREVTVVMQGRQRDRTVLGNPPVIRLVIDSVTSPVMRRELAASMVEGYQPELFRPVSVRPSEVELRFERNVTRRVPVEPDITASSAAGFAVVPPPVLRPESVTVSGPQSDVASVESVTTREARFEDLRGSVSRELGLLRPRGLDRVQLQPTSVLVTVEVDSVVQRTLRAPLAVEGGAAGTARPDRDSVLVRIRGPRRVVTGYSAARLRAFVRVDSLPDEVASFPVRVEVPEDSQITTVPDPARVRVRRVRGQP